MEGQLRCPNLGLRRLLARLRFVKRDLDSKAAQRNARRLAETNFRVRIWRICKLKEAAGLRLLILLFLRRRSFVAAQRGRIFR